MVLLNLRVLLISAMLLCSLFMPAARATYSEPPSREYVFGVVPQFEQRKLHAIWKPIIEALQRRTGLKFKLVTTLSIQDFEEEFASGGFDFPLHKPISGT